MTGLPITSTLPTHMLPQRDASLLMTHRPAGAVTAVATTMTEQAIQQSRPLDPGSLETRSRMRSILKHPRLAGPPPAFELSLLQQLRETQRDPVDISDDDLPNPGSSDELVTDERQHDDFLALYDGLAERELPASQMKVDKLI